MKPPLISPGASVVIVGNGPSLMRADLGAQIDSFDEVIRFNECRTHGFERHTGSKTTVWCTFGRGMLPGDAEIRPDKIILTHEGAKPAYPAPHLYPVPRTFYNALQEEIKAGSIMPDKSRLMPSSGFLVVRWLLDTGLAEEVTITGFDHFSKAEDKRHHYWNEGSYGVPKEHDGNYEREMLATYVQMCRLNYLTP